MQDWKRHQEVILFYHPVLKQDGYSRMARSSLIDLVKLIKKIP